MGGDLGLCEAGFPDVELLRLWLDYRTTNLAENRSRWKTREMRRDMDRICRLMRIRVGSETGSAAGLIE